MVRQGERVVYIMSDATGETPYRVVRAALAQFKNALVEIRWRQGARTPEQVEAVVDEAAAADAMIAHSLVVPALREALVEASRARGVVLLDVIGPAMFHFADWLEREPAHQPGLTRSIDAEYFRRITAMEFAVQHDDGRNADELHEADLVLVGVSRTSKTPLTMTFAMRGWLVGNVPLVPGVEPPEVLFELPQQRVIALTVKPERLMRLRGTRESWLGVAGGYGDPEAIREELRAARQVVARGGWPVVDMTVKSIEEAATEILEIVGRTPRSWAAQETGEQGGR